MIRSKSMNKNNNKVQFDFFHILEGRENTHPIYCKCSIFIIYKDMGYVRHDKFVKNVYTLYLK